MRIIVNLHNRCQAAGTDASYSFQSKTQVIGRMSGLNAQQEFKKSGVEGKCIEARELIIALPESLFEQGMPNIVLRSFTNKLQAKRIPITVLRTIFFMAIKTP